MKIFDRTTEIESPVFRPLIEKYKLACDDYWRNLSSLDFREGLIVHQERYLELWRRFNLNEVPNEKLLEIKEHNVNLQSLTFKKWSEDFEASVESWDYSSIQTYIDGLIPYPYFGMDDINVVQKLFDTRHHIRLQEMEKIRRNFQSSSAEVLLKNLLHDESIILDFYPVEIAEYVLDNGVGFLTELELEKFKALVADAPFRIWKKVIDQVNLAT